MNEIIGGWHASIGKAILENWDFAEEMSQAVGQQDDNSRKDTGPADLADVIAVAIVISSHGMDVAGLESALRELPAAKRLGLDESKTMAVMQDSAAEVTALSQALGG